MASNESRENYKRILNGFDMYKAGIEGLRFRLERDIRDARLGNCTPELFQGILEKAELLRRAEQSTPEIEGMLLAHGVEIGEIAIQ
jgi:hypothetical protein